MQEPEEKGEACNIVCSGDLRSYRNGFSLTCLLNISSTRRTPQEMLMWKGKVYPVTNQKEELEAANKWWGQEKNSFPKGKHTNWFYNTKWSFLEYMCETSYELCRFVCTHKHTHIHSQHIHLATFKVKRGHKFGE